MGQRRPLADREGCVNREFGMAVKVFISHSSVDTWVAKQIASHIHSCGVETFLDEASTHYGDDFEQRILSAVRECEELLVLITPWSVERPYVWMEIGAFWGSQRRIVGVLHGITAKALAAHERMPVALKRSHLIDLNDIESYFLQLKTRCASGIV